MVNVFLSSSPSVVFIGKSFFVSSSVKGKKLVNHCNYLNPSNLLWLRQLQLLIFIYLDKISCLLRIDFLFTKNKTCNLYKSYTSKPHWDMQNNYKILHSFMVSEHGWWKIIWIRNQHIWSIYTTPFRLSKAITMVHGVAWCESPWALKTN